MLATHIYNYHLDKWYICICKRIFLKETTFGSHLESCRGLCDKCLCAYVLSNNVRIFEMGKETYNYQL